MTPELESVIDRLKDNFKIIKQLHSDTLQENSELKAEISKLKAEIEENNNNRDELDKKYESLKLAKVIAASSTDAHDAKIKLNRIVREIDKCISLLNK